MSDTPTQIDPADIRPGDVVERRYRLTICQVFPGYVISEDGSHWAKDAEDVTTTWHLVSRPDPDAEVVEALNVAGVADAWPPVEHDRRKACAAVLMSLREQGFDVTKRAET